MLMSMISVTLVTTLGSSSSLPARVGDRIITRDDTEAEFDFVAFGIRFYDSFNQCRTTVSCFMLRKALSRVFQSLTDVAKSYTVLVVLQFA
jgi:hypothetical protein